MPKRLHLIGQVFGRWTVLSIGTRGPTNAIRYLCECSCGTFRLIPSKSLVAGESRSCGCARSERFSNRIHGQSPRSGPTPIYHAWKNMRARCCRSTNPEYGRYGGRGITVCPEWQEFARFYADMAPTWEPGLTLERLDNNGNYCPENAAWRSQLHQVHNRRPNGHGRKAEIPF